MFPEYPPINNATARRSARGCNPHPGHMYVLGIQPEADKTTPQTGYLICRWRAAFRRDHAMWPRKSGFQKEKRHCPFLCFIAQGRIGDQYLNKDSPLPRDICSSTVLRKYIRNKEVVWMGRRKRRCRLPSPGSLPRRFF